MQPAVEEDQIGVVALCRKAEVAVESGADFPLRGSHSEKSCPVDPDEEAHRTRAQNAVPVEDDKRLAVVEWRDCRVVPIGEGRWLHILSCVPSVFHLPAGRHKPRLLPLRAATRTSPLS